MKQKHKRLLLFSITCFLISIASFLILTAFEKNIVFFHTPSEIKKEKIKADRRIRLGGLVAINSLKQGTNGVIMFQITDTITSIPTRYQGILPDLFREGQGVVAEGKFENGTFRADEILAKHDENYMPPEVAAAIKEAREWKDMMEYGVQFPQ